MPGTWEALHSYELSFLSHEVRSWEKSWEKMQSKDLDKMAKPPWWL